ncbi:MAG TPA: CHAT domain-containing tetratricopeptide repeat protein [Streptosporangiaceae bacterium]|nr:CHAT domain-containing tetratricopeptide repeat protein [Streptosporangiaceae bacterium]
MLDAVEPAAGLAGPIGRAQRRARDAHRAGLQAGAAGQPAIGARRLRSGLAVLGWTEHDQRPASVQVAKSHYALTARLLMSLAHFEAEQGRTEHGMSLLDQAEPLTADEDRGILLYQRGLTLLRIGKHAQALPLFDEAVILLQDYPDPADPAVALLNRGVLHLSRADLLQARADLRWCERIAKENGLDLIAAKAVHNLGYCDLLGGDIPAALALFEVAADVYGRLAPGNLPVLAMDKARALIAAGLADDAAAELETAIVAFRRQRLDQDHAEAELARAQAALAVGGLAAARKWAAAAQRHFRRRGNDTLACLAELTVLRARSASSGRGAAAVAAEALGLAERLRGFGLGGDADMAELVAARALIAAGRLEEAAGRIATVRRRGSVLSLEVGLLRRLVRSELAEREGRPELALAELRDGLTLVQVRRGTLGSVDLQTGTAALGADLAAAGLRLALEHGSAAAVFAWLERSRAQAFRARPVRPPADQEAAAVLAELRALGLMIRQAELSGQRDAAAIARRAELRRTIRERSWRISGVRESIAQASLGDVSDALVESGQTLVGILVHGTRMHAVLVRTESVRVVRLGEFASATEAAARLTADLDILSGRRLPDRLEAVVKESISRQIDVLTAEIIAPLRPSLGDGGLVIVPAGALASVPWNMLPDLHGRPVCVCPSASSWLAAWQRDRPSAHARQVPPFVAAGPDLEHAEAEVAEIANVYPGCRPLQGDKATVSAALRSLDGAWLAHLAAHGHHEHENVLFSNLDLADGPLMAYDVEQLATAPYHVVLSACDVGRTVVRPGEEVLGFTAALLYVGTATVISAVSRVADHAALSVMTRYHHALRGGARPAEALAKAAEVEPFSPFVCFGAG